MTNNYSKEENRILEKILKATPHIRWSFNDRENVQVSLANLEDYSIVVNAELKKCNCNSQDHDHLFFELYVALEGKSEPIFSFLKEYIKDPNVVTDNIEKIYSLTRKIKAESDFERLLDNILPTEEK